MRKVNLKCKFNYFATRVEGLATHYLRTPALDTKLKDFHKIINFNTYRAGLRDIRTLNSA